MMFFSPVHCTVYQKSSQPTLPSAPYHNVRSTQYCNSTKWLELDLNASEVREVPSAWCPVWGAQCGMPSVWCPVPSQGSLLDPRSRAQKGRLVRKARPSQAAGLPHFARVRTRHFPFLFLIQHRPSFPAFFDSLCSRKFLVSISPPQPLHGIRILCKAKGRLWHLRHTFCNTARLSLLDGL